MGRQIREDPFLSLNEIIVKRREKRFNELDSGTRREEWKKGAQGGQRGCERDDEEEKEGRERGNITIKQIWNAN